MPYVWLLVVALSGAQPAFSNFGSWPDLAQCEQFKADMAKAFPKQVSDHNARCIKFPVAPAVR
jgi:hypothetical protein